MRTLGEDIVLLALRQDGKLRAVEKVPFALSGSELVRLAAARRLTVEKGRVSVLDASPTGDPRLDDALVDIARHRRPPKASDWVGKARSGHLNRYLEALADAGVIRRERYKALGFIPASRWLLAERAPLDAARARLDALALTDRPADAVQAALGGLVRAIGLDRALYPGREGQPARQRLKRLAERDPAARAVGGAVRAAVDAAVDASVDAAVSASVHAAVHASVHATQHAADHGGAGGHHGGGGGGHH